MHSNDREEIHYAYNERSWVRSIANHAGVDRYVRFLDSLVYFPNGNIAQQVISNRGHERWSDLEFVYGYDGLSRLVDVQCITNNDFNETFSYDPDGNFTTKIGFENSLQYNYDEGTNRLASIDVNQSEVIYTHDHKGNVVYDGYREYAIGPYDHRNLPLRVHGNGITTDYNYDDQGQRIYKQSGGAKEYYLRDHTGRELAVYDMEENRLKMINLYGTDLFCQVDVLWRDTVVTDPETGLPMNVTWRYDNRRYHIKDHLGSIRETVAKDGTILSAQDYFAYGELIPGRSYNAGSANDKYKYTGKERDMETGYSNYGVRLYDPWRGQWNQLDPLARLYPGITPYSFTANNPISRREVDGKYWQSVHRDFTRTVLVEMGYSASSSNIVAWANSDTDLRQFPNFFHAMSDFAENRWVAARLARAFIDETLAEAVGSAEQTPGLALVLLGIVHHVIQDEVAHYYSSWVDHFSPFNLFLGVWVDLFGIGGDRAKLRTKWITKHFEETIHKRYGKERGEEIIENMRNTQTSGETDDDEDNKRFLLDYLDSYSARYATPPR